MRENNRSIFEDQRRSVSEPRTEFIFIDKFQLRYNRDPCIISYIFMHLSRRIDKIDRWCRSFYNIDSLVLLVIGIVILALSMTANLLLYHTKITEFIPKDHTKASADLVYMKYQVELSKANEEKPIPIVNFHCNNDEASNWHVTATLPTETNKIIYSNHLFTMMFEYTKDQEPRLILNHASDCPCHKK